MAQQNRVFYAVQSLAVSKCGLTTFTNVHGLQSVGVNTKYNLEQVFEIGQISIYYNLENIPDIELTTEKVLDGYPLVYHLATNGATSATLSGRSAIRSTFGLSIFTDTQDSASGTPVSQCMMSGMYVSTIGYKINVDGNSVENLTMVGNNKTWLTSFTVSAFNNNDAPLAGSASGYVNRRQDLLVGTGNSQFPTEIPGISGDGYLYANSDGSFPTHIQSISVTSNLGRPAIYELGRRGPYLRYITFPVEVQTDIEILSTAGDKTEALEAPSNNVFNQTMRFKMREGTNIYLGTQNKLQSTTYGGANAGTNGGNATVTYSYITFNDLTVTHPADPSGL